MIIISINFIFNVTNFCVIVGFFTNLLPLCILFSTAVRAVIVAKLVVLGIFLTSFILVLRAVLLVKLVISVFQYFIIFY